MITSLASTFLYQTSNNIAKGTWELASLATQGALKGVTYIYPPSESLCDSLSEKISDGLSQLSRTEIIGPAILTLGSAYLAMRSAHKVFRNFKMLVTGKRLEVFESHVQKQKGAILKNRVFLPHNTSDLMISTLIHSVAAPVLAGMSYFTAKAIQDRLIEFDFNGYPLGALVLGGIATAYIADQYLNPNPTTLE